MSVRKRQPGIGYWNKNKPGGSHEFSFLRPLDRCPDAAGFSNVVAKVPTQHRTSSNQAAIASRILAVAAEGRRSEAILTAEADGSEVDIHRAAGNAEG